MICDRFYRKMEEVVSREVGLQHQEYLRSKGSDERKQDFESGFLATMWGEGTGSDRVAENIASVGLLIEGARRVYEMKNSVAIPYKLLPLPLGDNATYYREILKIFDGLFKEDATKVLMGTLGEATVKYRELTGRGMGDFIEIVRKGFDTAIAMYPGFELPTENPGKFLLRTVRRRELHRSIIDLEEVYEKRSKEEWASALQNGDISSYTIAVSLELLDRRLSPLAAYGNGGLVIDQRLRALELISSTTSLPIVEVSKSNKDVFPTTFEWKNVSDEELKELATRGVNKWLPAVKAYHERRYNPESALYMGDVYGKEGSFFSEGMESHVIPLDMDFKFIEEGDGGITYKPDINKHGSCILAAWKLHVLRNVVGIRWQDVSQEPRQWYEKAANDKLRVSLNFIDEKLKRPEEYRGLLNVPPHQFYEWTNIFPWVKDVVEPEIAEKYKSLEKEVLEKDKERKN